MVVHSLWSVVAAIVVLVVVVHPRLAASASGRGRFGLRSVDQGDFAVAGLCSLANIMHAGYKCQEYHDCKLLLSSKAWHLDKAHGFNFFPGTQSIEVLAVFKRGPGIGNKKKKSGKKKKKKSTLKNI